MIQVNESDGNCKSCGKFAVLGDGLCAECWDAKTDEEIKEERYHRYTIDDYKQIWQLHIEKSFGCRRIARELNLPAASLERILQRLHLPEYQLILNKTEG